MVRRFFQSLVPGCVAGLSVAAIDGTAGFIAAGSRFRDVPFTAASTGLVALLVLAAFVLVRWLLVTPLARRIAADTAPLSIGSAMGVAAAFVVYDVDLPRWNVSGLFGLLVNAALGAAVGAGAYALAIIDARKRSMSALRYAGRALPFAMPLALAGAWFAFVRVDDVTSVRLVLIVVLLLAAVFVAARVAARITPMRWAWCVMITFGAVVASGIAGAALVGRDAPFVLSESRGRKVRGNVSRVVMLTVDTLRRDALSCYGSTTVATPNIDRIAARGVMFTNAVASSSWTVPSFASMMTGLTTRAHGMAVSTAALPDTLITLAERFRASGYITHALVANGILAPHRGFAQGFERYYLPSDRRRPVSIGEALASPFRRAPLAAETSTDDVTDAAIAWTRRNQNRDFFLWVHYLDPHLPYAPPESFVERMNVHDEMGFALDITSAMRPTMDLFGDPARQAWARSLYDGEVRHVDAEIGRLIDALEEMGIYDDALLVFGVDHGEEFWDHDGFEHGHTLYTELIGVPLIFKPPGSRAPRVVAETVAIYDVAPTVLELCDLPALRTPRAISLSGYLTGVAPRAGARPVFASGTLFRSNFECVVFDGWKYIRSATTGREELFRLSDDPLERNSLVLDQPDVVRRGRQLIDEHARSTEAFRAARGISNPEIKLDAEEIERLRSLGYL